MNGSINMWLQIILVCTTLTIVQSWILPPGDFLSDFASEHDRTSIIIYLPQNIPQKWIKNHFVSGSTKSQLQWVEELLEFNKNVESLNISNSASIVLHHINNLKK